MDLLASSTNKDETLFVGFSYGLNKIPYGFKWIIYLLCGLVHILLYYLSYALASFKRFMVHMIIILLICCVCHGKMQWCHKKYQLVSDIVVLLLQTNITKNSIDANTGINASLTLIEAFKKSWFGLYT